VGCGARFTSGLKGAASRHGMGAKFSVQGLRFRLEVETNRSSTRRPR